MCTESTELHLWCYFGFGHSNATSQVRLHGIRIVKALNMEVHVLSGYLMSSTNNLFVSTIFASMRQHQRTYQLMISFARKQCSSTCTQFKTSSPGLEQLALCCVVFGQLDNIRSNGHSLSLTSKACILEQGVMRNKLGSYPRANNILAPLNRSTLHR